MTAKPRARLEAGFFDDLYAADPDPWGFATSPYEAGKYARTLAALEGRRFGRALEVGCSIGVFTRMLAPACDELLGIDVSGRALGLARERLGDLPHVRVERRGLPEEMPSGPWELVVCSEVLYYLTPADLDEALDAIERELAPGAMLLAVHWRPETNLYPLLGDEVHDRLRARLGPPAYAESTPDYRLERFDR